jgi:hypothetical protein
VLKHTQQHVIGMQVQKGSWQMLKQQLPCVACLTGHMRKTNKTPLNNYTDVNNLAVTWTSNTEVKIVTPNEEVAVDWAIINKRLLPNKNNVFALYVDVNTGLVFTYPAPSRGVAGPSLLAYIQQFGCPKLITHDNAKEFKHGEFGEICLQKSITSKPTPPFDHNENPTERYIEILTSMTRSLLAISGLDSNEYWEHALTHATCIQNRTASAGRTTPYESTYGRKPDVTHLRTFGCEALAYIEKDKRHKLQSKVQRCIYLGMSLKHSDDTVKLLSLKTMEIVYRRNVHFNERSYPARKQKLNPSQTHADTGEDLLGLQFEVSECPVSLFGKPVITGHELAAGTPSIELGCHSHISDGGAFVAQTSQFVVYL